MQGDNLATLATLLNSGRRHSQALLQAVCFLSQGLTWKLAYCLMQKGWAVLRVMACSQKTCSGHCTTALLRMRFMAYWRPEVSSAAHKEHLNMASAVTAESCRQAWRCLWDARVASQSENQGTHARKKHS